MLFLDRVKDQFPDLKNIFEVGAHRGSDIYEISKLWPDANIFAFEADPFNCEIMRSKFKEHKNVKIYNVAISNRDGIIPFYRYYPVEDVPDDKTFEGKNLQNTGVGSILEPGDGLKNIFGIRKIHEEIKVKSVTLHEFCQQNKIESIDAIFMDIQGAEYYAFEGCKELLNTVKATVFEWSRDKILYKEEKGLEEISKLLISYGLKESLREYQLANISGDSLFMKGINNGE